MVCQKNVGGCSDFSKLLRQVWKERELKANLIFQVTEQGASLKPSKNNDDKMMITAYFEDRLVIDDFAQKGTDK